jgi:hypothetical protein
MGEDEAGEENERHADEMDNNVDRVVVVLAFRFSEWRQTRQTT